MHELIFMDLEWNTTFYRNREGVRLPFHELLEVAAMKVDPASGAMVDSFHSYIHPTVGRKIEGRTYRLLPYGREELRALLADAPDFLDLGPAFLHWCGDAPVFVEWGNNDMEVLLDNFAHHQLRFDAGWKCEFFDLQYVYQRLHEGSLACQPSLEKAVTDLGIETDLDFHSAWNDTYYTILVYQVLLDRFEGLQLFRRPPKQKGRPPLWEAELGSFDTRWACKNRPEVARPACPLCGGPLTGGRWVRTLPTEQVLRCRCKVHRRMYLAVTVEKDGRQWQGKAAIYKDAGPIAERYRKTLSQLKKRAAPKKKKPLPAE